MKHRTTSRAGAALVIAIGLLAVTAMLLAAWVRSAIHSERVQRTREHVMQSAWLAEAGLERAAARLAADGDYTGETWRISADELGQSRGANIVIRVGEVGDRRPERTVSVRADYPDDPTWRVRTSKQVVVRVGPR
ncbi:MAG: hypothetical protein ACC645_09465 [Pirellulales bacterium]